MKKYLAKYWSAIFVTGERLEYLPGSLDSVDTEILSPYLAEDDASTTLPAFFQLH